MTNEEPTDLRVTIYIEKATGIKHLADYANNRWTRETFKGSGIYEPWKEFEDEPGPSELN